jgi:hypothetical protein
VPLFIFEELFSSKTVYLCLEESLKRDKEEAEELLESCKKMIQTNQVLFEDKTLFKDLTVDLFKWIAALEELPIPLSQIYTYLMDFAVERKSVEIMSEVRSELDRHDRKVTQVLKVVKSGDFLPTEKFSIRYKNESVDDVLLRAYFYSSDQILQEHSRLYVDQNNNEIKYLEKTSLLADHNISPGDIVFIEVKKQIQIRMIDGKQETVFVDFNAKRIRDLKVQISDLLETEDMNTILLMMDGQVLDDMMLLDTVVKGDERVLSASLRGDPIDAANIVVGYGDENVIAWPGVVITASCYNEDYEPFKAVKGSGSLWDSEIEISLSNWWQCEFQFPVVIGFFEFDGSWSRSLNNFHVTSFRIEGSLDEENWILLTSQEEIPEWLGAKTFTCQNVKAFRFYRLTCIKTTEPNSAAINKLHFSESLF